MAYYPKEWVTIFTGRTLPPSATTVISSELPVGGGEGWYRLRLHLSGVLAAVATPFADGLYRFLKGITLRTNRGEVLYDNMSGMAVYRMNQDFYHKSPWHQPMLAAGGTFAAVLDLPLVHPYLNRPEDTIFDTARYSSVELQLTTGALAVFAPAAPATCPVTFGLEVERSLEALDKDGRGKPLNHFYAKQYQNNAIATTLFWNLESAMDLGLFGFHVSNQDVLLVEGAVPFCHPAAGAVDNLAQITMQDSVRTWINQDLLNSFRKRRDDLLYYDEYDGNALPIVATEIPTSRLGQYPYFFVKNGSINEQYWTARQAQIQLSYTLVGAAGTQRADLFTFGQRALR